MATALKNLSDYNPDSVPDGSGFKFAIVVSEWNHGITGALLDGAVGTLKKHGVRDENILVRWVPGSFELPFAAKLIADKGVFDGIICLGCVIQGETPHFTYVCEGVTQGIMHLNTTYHIPFIFGVLTTDTLEQAKDRAGGKLGNKGDEAAVAAIKMVALGDTL